MSKDARQQLEKDLIRSAENITAEMLVRTPEVNVSLIITVAKEYAKRSKQIELQEVSERKSTNEQ